MKRISLLKAFDHLSKDPVMNFLIAKFSKRIDWGNRFDENNAKSIANLIIEQQISFKAAITVKKRFSDLIKNKSNFEINPTTPNVTSVSASAFGSLTTSGIFIYL